MISVHLHAHTAYLSDRLWACRCFDDDVTDVVVESRVTVAAAANLWQGCAWIGGGGEREWG